MYIPCAAVSAQISVSLTSVSDLAVSAPPPAPSPNNMRDIKCHITAQYYKLDTSLYK